MRELIIDWIKSYYYSKSEQGTYFDETLYNEQIVWWTIGLFVCLAISSLIIWVLSRLILIKLVHVAAGKTKATWYDKFVSNRVFRGLALLVPLMFMEYFLSLSFFNYPVIFIYSSKVVDILIVLVGIIIINRFFNALRDIIKSKEVYKDKPIQSYTQVLKIIFSGILIIIILSILTNKSPVFFLTSLGAISAVVLLIFRDTLLGFVGSIQLSANNMIRVGDWVTMRKYGADGDVQEINVTTVKVRNFDKTITTIPTYAFISDSFINWRGMEESGGRRIKRSVNVQLDSIKFATPDMLENLMKIKLIKGFIEERQNEIIEYNKKNGFEENDIANGRNQTNIGLFRRYIEYYLRNNPEINSNMTLMVRQLDATNLGVPLEIYCFTKTKEWSAFENVAADIFDHIFAIIGIFELNMFESPTGGDFKQLVKA
jgi:miniconductance mechanosensitive channel